MCAFYDVQITEAYLNNLFTIELSGEITTRINPYVLAPVIVKSASTYKLTSMNFSLVPHWSKEPKVKFATHNARLLSEPNEQNKLIPIYEKPTWKIPFQKNHCLVPLIGFIEPIYTNDLAGNMVTFFSKTQEPLLAAGIHDVWIDKLTGEILESFAILTHEPPTYVASVGHDRCPVFITPDIGKEWLNLTNIPSGAQLSFLLDNLAQIDFDVKIDRPLKKGWEKRIS